MTTINILKRKEKHKKPSREQKTITGKKTCKNISRDDAFKLFKNINQGRSVQIVKDKSGKTILSNVEIANKLVKQWSLGKYKDEAEQGNGTKQRKTNKGEEVEGDGVHKARITEEEIVEIIKNMKLKKAGGPDNVQNLMLKLPVKTISKY